MAGSGSSLWPTLLAGQRARASEVEFKFDWLEANIIPMLSGSTTDLTYDLGTETKRWSTLYVRSINDTTTSGPLVVGTTTAVNNSDVTLELAGPGSFIWPRLTTTQRNNLAGVNGMSVYDSSLNQFYAYENGSWKAMLGNPIGFVFPVFASVTSVVTTTVISVSAPGRLLRISSQMATGTNKANLEFNLDGVLYGDIVNNNTVTTSYVYLANTTTANTAGVFVITTAAQDFHGLDLYFKNTLIVYHRVNPVASAATQTGVWYERT